MHFILCNFAHFKIFSAAYFLNFCYVLLYITKFYISEKKNVFSIFEYLLKIFKSYV